MKKTLILILVTINILPINAQVSRSITIEQAGTLNKLFTTDELKSITDLTISGQIDQRDFVTMRDSMQVLANIDLKNTSIMAYGNYAANEVPDNAFHPLDWVGKQTIKSIIFPSNVTTIGNYAFSYCFNLNFVTFPETLTKIKDYAFYSCKNLIEINFPASLVSIGEEAFLESNTYICKCNTKTPPTLQEYSLYNARIVFVPKGSKDYYKSANFWSDKFIIDGQETINSGVKHEGVALHLNIYTPGTLSDEIEAAGYYENEISNLILEGTLDDTDLTNIKQNMPNLNFLDISKTDITSMPVGIFADKKDLLDIELPETLKTIPENAFKGCTGITKIKFPNSLKHIEKNAFYNCTCLTDLEFQDSLTYIGENAFNSCMGIQAIKFPPIVTRIDNYAFQNCINLKNIVLPDSLTFIGSSTFANCINLESFNIPAKLDTIGNSAFSCCINLTDTKLPETLTFIGTSAFEACKRIPEIIIPDGVTSIENYTFANCINLKTVQLPSKLTIIKDISFQGCTNLAKINFPETLSQIGYAAFKNCISLSNLTLSDKIWCIGNYAFGFCHGLSNIYLPKNLITIGESAFLNCTGLTDIDCPDEITLIAKSAFAHCKNVTNIKLPKKLMEIGYYTFNFCDKLNSICFPENLTVIGDYIFSTYNNISEIKNLSPTPQKITKWTFYSVNKETCKLIVPYGTIDAYRAATGWSEFKNIIELQSTGISSSKQSSLKVWNDNGLINISSEKSIRELSLFSLSGKIIAKKQSIGYSSQIEANSEKIFILKVIYEDSSSEVIKIAGSK